MAALRVALLLDADPKVVSFQTVYHLLKDPDVTAALVEELEARRGPDVFTPTRAALINQYLVTYREIDWNVHGRLTHFRNLGIAHLTLRQLQKSVTFAELGTLVDIVVRLASNLQHLIETGTALHESIAKESRDQVKGVIKLPKS